MNLSIIVAVADNDVIGSKGQLPWNQPKDLKYFRKTTIGKTIIVGRLTFESFGGKPLPKRRNMVLSRRPGYSLDGAEVYPTITHALSECSEDEEVFVCGGAAVYSTSMKWVNKIYITRIHARPEGDAYIHQWDMTYWDVESQEEHAADNNNPYDMTFEVYRRRI